MKPAPPVTRKFMAATLTTGKGTVERQALGFCPWLPSARPRKDKSSSSSGQCRPNGESSMWFNCGCMPRASRGLSATGKRISAPLSMRTMICPFRCSAVTAMSVNVFMPLLNYQLFIFFRKFFGLGQFPELEALRLAQFHLMFHLEHRFAAAVADVDVNRAMLVAVKEKPESVFFKNVRHGSNFMYKNCGPDEDKK